MELKIPVRAPLPIFLGGAFFVVSLIFGLVAGAQTPALVRGPYLQTVTPNSTVLCWRTDIAADAKIQYGPSPSLLNDVVTDTQEVVEHQVLIDNLSAATRYYYNIGTSDAVLEGGTEDFWFETAPTGNDRPPVQIWVMADSGTADANSRAVRDGYLASIAGVPSDVWLMAGDNALYSGTDEQYQTAVFDTYPTILRHTPLLLRFAPNGRLNPYRFPG